MKKTLLRISFLSFMILMMGCKKDNMDDARPYEDNFKFYFKAHIDGIPITLNAGEGGYVLNTDYTVEDSVLSMSGTLSHKQDSLRNSVMIRIRGVKVTEDPHQINMSEMLVEGTYAYRDPSGFKVDQSLADFHFMPDSSGGNHYLSWHFPDGSIIYNPNAVYRADITSANDFNVKLNTYSGTICNVNTTHSVNIQPKCDATFNFHQNQDLSIDFMVQSRSGTIESVKWIIDDAEVGGGETLSFSGGSFSNMEVKTEILFESGCSKTVIKDLQFTGGILNACRNDFSYTREAVKIEDLKQLATVEVIYLDASGKRYTSYFTNNTGNFSLKSIKPYKENENGMPTSRFIFEGSTILKAADGSTVIVSDAFGNFVVAHP